MLYKWNMETNAVDNMNACKGHESSVDCLAADREGKFIASGSFDTTLKIWGAKLQGSAHWITKDQQSLTINITLAVPSYC